MTTTTKPCISRLLAAATLSCVLGSPLHAAAAPALIPLQGFLADADGAALDGSYTIDFRIYDDPAAGTQLYSEILDVTVVEGFFTVYLGDTTPLDLATFRDNDELFLALKVGSDEEGTPRLQLASTPWSAAAAYCGDAETLGGAALTDLRDVATPVPWTDLSGVPADLADGDDVLSQASVEGYARGVCYDTQAELTTALSGQYAAAGHGHSEYAASSHGHGAADITSGTLADARFSAYSDLTAEGYLDASGNGDLVTLGNVSTAGTINTASNPVDWTKLKGVPAALADGTDNDSGGDIAGITTAASSGLSGGCTSGTCALAVSPTALHGAAPAVSSFNNALVALTTSYATVHSLSITVPRAGLIVAMYDGMFYPQGLSAGNTLVCANYGFTLAAAGTPSPAPIVCSTFGSGATEYDRVPHTSVLPATGAGTYTVYVRASVSTAGDMVNAYNHNLTLFFIPT